MIISYLTSGVQASWLWRQAPAGMYIRCSDLIVWSPKTCGSGGLPFSVARTGRRTTPRRRRLGLRSHFGEVGTGYG